MRRRIRATILVSIPIPALAAGATFTVTNTNDSAPGSLRQAILDANGTAGAHLIEFKIPGTGVHIITPLSALPAVTGSVVIDGATQPGYVERPLIELSGVSAGRGSDGLRINGDYSEIHGLSINRFQSNAFGEGGNGIVLEHGSRTRVDSCYIGTDPAEKGALGNEAAGILILDSSNNWIGYGAGHWGNRIYANGTGIVISGGDANVISANIIGAHDPFGNDLDGIRIEDAVGTHVELNQIYGSGGNGLTIGPGASGTHVYRNWIGLRPLVNRGNAIEINGSANNDISTNSIFDNQGNGISLRGGAATNVVEGNTIGGAGSNGVFVSEANDNEVVLNKIRNSAGHGVLIDRGASRNRILGNRIGSSGHAGIFIASGTGNALRSNSIVSSGGLGIDLAPAGVTANDFCDSDTGPNNLQNFPVLSSATSVGAKTNVLGSLNSTATTSYQIEFFADTTCDPLGRGQGLYFLGSTEVMTDASCLALIDATLPIPTPGAWISATATDPAGNTSEFSACVELPAPGLASIAPTSGPARGGTTLNLTGVRFQSGSNISIGSIATENPTFPDDMHATAISPALAPGALYDVVVTNVDGLSATLPNAWLADFLDVPQAHPFHNFVEKLLRHAVTAGCTAGNFCPGDPVTRAQVTVFLLRSHDGSTYVPPPATGTVFADVPAGSFAAPWIEQLAARSITAGCGAGNFCPQSPVTREQMAVFLLRTEHGASYVPPDPTGIFADVPVSSPFARWVERLAAEGITGGCGGGNFCPQNATTRGQMAVFLVTAFGLM